MASSVNSSLLAIRNALREDVPYGLSPGGLATNAYNGHSFWDTETWMFPPLLALNPTLAASLLEYRRHRLPAAVANAKAHGQEGAMWPWESAVSGQPVSPWVEGDEFEIHITGDVARAFASYFYATHNITWLNATAWPVLSTACDFFAGRAVPVPLSARPHRRYPGAQGSNLTLLQVIGPDENAGVVDSNAYTNALARVTLDFCVEAAAALDGTRTSPATVARWQDVSDRLWLPLSAELFGGGLVHPQYSGYAGQPINQADVALLYYPLDLVDAIGPRIASNDLRYYQPLSSTAATKGYYTGDSAYSIAWLALGNRSAADAQLTVAFEHMDTAHFNVWSEVAHDGLMSGHLNFLTGAGGYLQNILHGYGGVRFTRSGLRLRPILPPHTRAVTLRALAFASCRLTAKYNGTELWVTLISEAQQGAAVHLWLGSPSGGPDEEELRLGQTLARPRADGDVFLIRAKRD